MADLNDATEYIDKANVLKLVEKILPNQRLRRGAL